MESPSGKRNVKIQIYRIPVSDAQVDCDVSVVYKEIRDTTWIPYTIDSLVGYDTILYSENIKVPLDTIVKEVEILNQKEWVHSQLNRYGKPNYTTVVFQIPQPKKADLIEEEIIGWAFWIGVDQEAKEAWNSNVSNIKQSLQQISSYLISPLGGLIVGLVSNLYTPSTGEDIHWQLVTMRNGEKTVLAYGKSIAAYRKVIPPLIYFYLENDNYLHGVEVNIIVSMVKKIIKYTYKEVQKYRVEPRYVKLHRKKMNIKKRIIILPSH